MKYLMTILINLATVILALIVVWAYARESFEYVAIFLAVYLIWVILRLIMRKKKPKKETMNHMNLSRTRSGNPS